jgi:hypothetical protein
MEDHRASSPDQHPHPLPRSPALGLDGGGTKVAPFCDERGGVVLNATIDRYAYAVIEPLSEPVIRFSASDQQQALELPLDDPLALDGPLQLHKAVYRALGYRAEGIVRHFGARFEGIERVHEIEAEPLELDALRARWARDGHPLIVGREVPDTARFGRWVTVSRSSPTRPAAAAGFTPRPTSTP